MSQTGERLERFERALQRVVKPGDVVLDLGTGLGVLALMALRAGARHVYAVESSDALDFARTVATAAGAENRITFLRGSSFHLEMTDRAHVLVTDTFGTFGLHPGGLTALIDARQRLLTAGAQCVPKAIRLCVSPLEDEDLYRQTVDVWNTPVCGVDFSPIRTFAVNTVYSARSSLDQMLSAAPGVTRLGLCEIDDANFSLSSAIRCTRDGTMHGLGCWFNAELAEGISVDNEPGNSTSGYAHMFAPLSRPITLHAGDIIHTTVQSYDNLELRWRVETGDIHVDQSTFFGFPAGGTATANRNKSRDSTSDTT